MAAAIDPQIEIGLQFERIQEGDEKTTVEALGLICMFLGRGMTKEQYPVFFQESLATVVGYIPHQTAEIRKNALAIMTAVLGNVDEGADLIDLSETFSNTLTAVREHPEDSATQINGLYCMSELVTAKECQLMEGFLGDGVQIAIDTAAETVNEQVAEAALHLMCCCAANHVPAREVLISKGALKSNAVLLAAPDMDTKVKAGMLAGMLVGQNPTAQEELAQQLGVAEALTALMRTNSDPDAKAIGTQLFALLVNNPAAKVHMEAALRGAAGKPADAKESAAASLVLKLHVWNSMLTVRAFVDGIGQGGCQMRSGSSGSADRAHAHRSSTR